MTELLLDTHVWLWLAEGLPIRCLAQLREASAQGGLRVSPVSCWEVGQLAARGRIQLSRPCHEWVEAGLSAPGLRLLELVPRMAVEASFLPGVLHNDPADRLLVASARVGGLALVTRDRRILDYAGQGHVLAVEA